MMESSSKAAKLADVCDLSEDTWISSPPQLGVRTFNSSDLDARSNTNSLSQPPSGDTFLNDEVLSSSSPLRTVDKVSTPEPATFTGFSTPEPATVTGFSSEFAKFLKSSSEELPRTLSQDFPPKACSVRLQQLYVDVTGLDMEAKSVAAVPSIDLTGTREPGKRDNDTVGATHDGPQNKRPKSDDVIILDGDSPNKSSSEISVVKQTKSPPKENMSSAEKKSEVKIYESKPKSDKPGPLKPLSVETGKKSDVTVPKTSKSQSTNSKSDNSDRTSLLSLEARLLDLQQKHQQKSKSNDNHQKIKSMSPSGIKQSKDNHHRRNENFILDRKKSVSSPVKKVVKKPYSAPSTPRENKLGGLFCPTTDAKVTIMPCKTAPKEGEQKPATVGSNSVTITKVSSGDTLSVQTKDIKKVFSPKSESKIKLSSGAPFKHSKSSPKDLNKEKFKSGEKSDKLHKEHRHREKEYRSKDTSKEGRSGERRERVGSLKIIRCSKCREVFSTKEAKKLHTCNSILDAHYLIDGGDRQKTSPVSSASNSDRSESTSASLSRSSSRSSSPGIPISNPKKAGDSPKSKVVKKLEDDKVAKVKISLGKMKPEDDKDKSKSMVKKDPMREKWIENKSGGKERMDLEGSLDRQQGLVMEATSLEGREMKGKEEAFVGDPGLFSFSGKRTYSPSMTESSNVDGKESPRETNSKDSPASQADSGVFSIASSASPSKIDGGINSDVRSPDSPRNMDAALGKDHSQWKLGINMSGSDPKMVASIPTIKSNPFHGKVEGTGNGFPPGISLPINTSITRVCPSAGGFTINSSSMGKGLGPGNPTWVNSTVNSHHAHLQHAYYLDEHKGKKRGRPRKNGDPIFSGKFKNPKPRVSDDDKDMYDFETEEDETKPMQPLQPLRPRRQNTQPVTYKDPDSDEDAKGKLKVPLIQATQGYKDIHERALSLNPAGEYDDSFNPDSSLTDDQGEMEGEEKDKNISYKCSTIEETPTGGIKLKIKIKKSASPVPQDPEPPLKKPKMEVENSEEFFKPEPSILTDTQRIPTDMQRIPTDMQRIPTDIQRIPTDMQRIPTDMQRIPTDMQRIPTDMQRIPTDMQRIPNDLQRIPSNLAPKIELEPDIPRKQDPVPPPVNPVISSTAQVIKPLSMMTPGLAGGMQPKNPTPPMTSPGVMPVRPFASNNNPPSSFPPSVSAVGPEELPKGPMLPKVQNPYAIQKPNFPAANSTNQNNFEMQQNFGSGNYGDFSNYNVSYNSYMDQQQHQQQNHMYTSNQYQQHIAAYRPAMRPVNPMMQRSQQPGAFMQNRIIDPRFPHHPSQLSDSEPIHPGMNSHMGGINMGMGMGPQMGPGSMSRHPSMMSGMMPNMSNPNIPHGSYSNSPMSVANAMNNKPMPGPGVVPKGPMMNSPVMSPISGHGGMLPRSMSPQSLGVPERQLVGPPSMSPQSLPPERSAMFERNQYRLSSPQYSPAHQQNSQPSFSHSPTYSVSQGYPQPNMSQLYKPPTPQSYPKPPTPQSYPKPLTPQSYPKPPTPQNPTTPVSYPNPSTPGAYQNPTTPLSQQNPLTPQSYDPQTPQGSQHNTSFESPTSQPVIQPNPHAATNSFIVPKTESVIQSPVHNVFSSKIAAPMLSPPSTTSSLRKIRRPSKSVTPGTVSPNQKNLSPNQPLVNVKMENDSVIVPKLEPMQSSPPGPPVPIKLEPLSQVKKEPDIIPKVEIKQEPMAEEDTKPQSPPPKLKTPEPPKDPVWGESGPGGIPEKALEKIFAYVSHTAGCLPFLPNAMRVCKLWQKIASQPKLWTHANLGTAVKEKLRSEKKLEWILKNKFSNAIQVDVTSWRAVMSTPALKIIAANCPKVSGLGLSNCVKLNFEDIRIVPSLFPNLERIDLSLVSPSTASSRSAVSSSALSDLITALGDKLTHFNMSSNKMAGLPFVFKALSSHAKNLKFLDVANISTTSRDTILINIEKLQKGCPKLTTFRTTNTMLGLNETPVREQVASPGFPFLEELTIGVDQRGYFDGMDDSQIERILKKSPKLRLLDIRGCKGISDSTLVRLPCWDIEYLYVAGCSVTSSSRDGLELLVKKWCKTLIELDIGLTSDQKTVDWAVMALVEYEDELRLSKLNLNGTAVSLKPLTKLLNCCEMLSSLNLSSCRALPRGMKRMYHSREDVISLKKDIADGKFDPRDAGSDEDD